MRCKHKKIRQKSVVKKSAKSIRCKKSAKLLMLTRAAGGLGIEHALLGIFVLPYGNVFVTKDVICLLRNIRMH
jgi:hypothetical protein